MVSNKRSEDHQKSPDHTLVAADTVELRMQATLMSILLDYIASQSLSDFKYGFSTYMRLQVHRDFCFVECRKFISAFQEEFVTICKSAQDLQEEEKLKL